jgi:hypothetical protein
MGSNVGMAGGDEDAGVADVDGEATVGSSLEHPTAATQSNAAMIPVLRIYPLLRNAGASRVARARFRKDVTACREKGGRLSVTAATMTRS